MEVPGRAVAHGGAGRDGAGNAGRDAHRDLSAAQPRDVDEFRLRHDARAGRWQRTTGVRVAGPGVGPSDRTGLVHHGIRPAGPGLVMANEGDQHARTRRVTAGRRGNKRGRAVIRRERAGH